LELEGLQSAVGERVGGDRLDKDVDTDAHR